MKTHDTPRHDDGSSTWPPQFPHLEIDELIRRIKEDDADKDDVAELLRLVAREAERLRSTVARLSVARLTAAEREASQIVAEAQQRSSEVRRSALSVLDKRLDEADELVQAIRRLFAIEQELHGPVTPVATPLSDLTFGTPNGDDTDTIDHD